MRIQLTLVCALAIFPGCTPNKPEPAQQPRLAPRVQDARGIFFPPDAQLVQRDAVPTQQLLVQMIAYQITVPVGSVSRNDDFWHHVNETAVDVGTHDLLYKNGVRVGVASAGEWDYFKSILEQNPAFTRPSSYSGRESGEFDLDMKLKVPRQILFYYDNLGDMVGKTYERCDNLMRVSFQPVPRKHGTVRIGLLPVVRSLREIYLAVGDVNQKEYKLVQPESFYPLNLTVDVPLDDILIVAPSVESKWSTSLGANFLIQDGVTDQIETLLIFRPLTFRIKAEERVATTAPSRP